MSPLPKIILKEHETLNTPMKMPKRSETRETLFSDILLK